MSKRIGANDALETMRGDARKSADSIGLRLGRARTWFGNIKGRDPHLSTVAAVASVTGHEVAILKADTGEVVATIAPPGSKAGESKAGESA